MLDFKQIKSGSEEWIETSLTGKPLLTTPQLNKGTAFTNEERHEFRLIGKLPLQVETLEQQVKRCYQQFLSIDTKLQKNVFLNGLLDTNHVLYYHLVEQHLAEMLPVIYTPIVGTAVKKYSEEFRQARGIYVSYPNRDSLKEILRNRSNPEIDLIVVTDGEGVLGIGDQGVGGMDIPIAKLMVYTLCGGINPARTLPILLDVGTNNQELLDDPLYLGLRSPRISEKEYDKFIKEFITCIQSEFPNIFLHWEDFGARNARRNLVRYREQICTFNDDMQGTGVVTLSAILAGVKSLKQSITDQRVVVFGAGTAGTGIADQICDAMRHEGLSKEEAYKHFWCLDRPGLLISDMELTDYQTPYGRDPNEVSDWNQTNNQINLLEVVKQVKPTILIGCSAQAGAFSKEVITAMCEYTERPIILPLSNPTEKAEGKPKDILEWTKGKALIATGSPFDPVEYGGKTIQIAQCNNALVFPGIGLGLISSKSKSLSDEMLWAATQALSESSPILSDFHAPLLPCIDDAQSVAKQIAIAVMKQAKKEGVSQIPENSDMIQAIEERYWTPRYLPYRLKK